MRMLLPFTTKGEVALFKKGDELVVEIGTLRRHIGLPRSMETLLPGRARLENQVLTIEMKEAQRTTQIPIRKQPPNTDITRVVSPAKCWIICTNAFMFRLP